VTAVLPTIHLVRHGETTWSRSGQHTGLTDLPLTERGEENARRLSDRLKRLSFAAVLTSPLRRAARTCELAGFAATAKVNHSLVEWDYGEYEGRRSDEIHRERPEWNVFRNGCPGGESPSQVAARADDVIRSLRAFKGDVLLFSHGHFLRALAARWLGIELEFGTYISLSAASLSTLAFEHDLSQPIIRLWNDTSHLDP
jgi:probable phosphoglycerate mutase